MSKRLIIMNIIVILMTLIGAVFIIYPTLVKAAEQQSAELGSYIRVDAINAVWKDGDNNKITKLPLPNYVAPGEDVNIGTGLYLENVGSLGYARFKADIKVDGAESDLISLTISPDWIVGEDGYYYYCNQDRGGKLQINDAVLVISAIRIADTFKNIDSGTLIEISLRAEVIEADKEVWRTEWGENLPNEWFKATQETK